MATPSSSVPAETRSTYWRRVLRPLFWWLLLVLVLFGIHTHQLWMEKTRLNFTVTLNGQSPFPEAVATFDDKPIFSGDKIPLGHHQLVVTHPQGESFSTNLMIWYGGQNLGTINLKRTMSVLSVSVNPPAPVLYIHGPEFDVTLTNTSGMTSSVPTDQYVIASRYAHWSRSDDVTVSRGMPTTWTITPRLGAAQITCNETDAVGQFMQADGQPIEAATFPYSICELPEGTYKVTAQHHNDVLSQSVNITANTTNHLALEFLYGEAELETDPAGATVQTDDGRYLGETPLKLVELKPGDWTFTLQRDGYETASATLTITADQSTAFQTNLISVNYAVSMIAARQALAAEDYSSALKAVGEAINAKPGDADALTLQRNAVGLSSLKEAKQFGSEGDFINGEKQLATTLEIFPDNTEAKALLQEYIRREPEQRERIRLDRLALPKKTFDSDMAYLSDTLAFESHELTTTQSAADTQTAIETELKTVAPAFQIIRSFMTGEIFRIEASQDFPGGSRRCEIVGGQSKDDETQIYFKVVEMKKAAFYNQPLGAMWGALPTKYTLIDPNQPQLDDKLKQQIADGVALVTARIQMAIGQTPAVTAPPPASP